MKDTNAFLSGTAMGGKTTIVECFQKKFSNIDVISFEPVRPNLDIDEIYHSAKIVVDSNEKFALHFHWNSGAVWYREEMMQYHLDKAQVILFVVRTIQGDYKNAKEEWRLLHRHLDREIPIVLAFNQIDIIEDMGIHPKDRIFASKSGIDPDNITDPIQIPYRQEGEVHTRDATPFEHTFIKAYEKMLDPKGRYPHFYTSALLGYNIDKALFKLLEMMEA